ncbi:MAG: hypothetical protein AVDCRST_MAG67-4156, partial [uncultured Solirubrobacteraceae bacterium]
ATRARARLRRNTSARARDEDGRRAAAAAGRRPRGCRAAVVRSAALALLRRWLRDDGDLARRVAATRREDRVGLAAKRPRPRRRAGARVRAWRDAARARRGPADDGHTARDVRGGRRGLRDRTRARLRGQARPRTRRRAGRSVLRASRARRRAAPDAPALRGRAAGRPRHDI